MVGHHPQNQSGPTHTFPKRLELAWFGWSHFELSLDFPCVYVSEVSTVSRVKHFLQISMVFPVALNLKYAADHQGKVNFLMPYGVAFGISCSGFSQSHISALRALSPLSPSHTAFGDALRSKTVILRVVTLEKDLPEKHHISKAPQAEAS